MAENPNDKLFVSRGATDRVNTPCAYEQSISESRNMPRVTLYAGDIFKTRPIAESTSATVGRDFLGRCTACGIVE